MTLDNTDYKIIMDALHVLATDDEVDISDEVFDIGDKELDKRLLALREHFGYLEKKSRLTIDTDK